MEESMASEKWVKDVEVTREFLLSSLSWDPVGAKKITHYL